jgi:hypothetical protein
MAIVSTHTFQSNVSTASNGTEFSPQFADNIVIEFSGAATAFDARFEECGASGAWYPIIGLKRSDFTTLADRATDKSSLWLISMGSIKTIRVRIVTTDAALTITGSLEVSD